MESSHPSTIHIAAACDDRYAMPLAAMLRSLTDGLTPHRSAVAHVVFDELSPDAMARVEDSVDRERLEIRWTPAHHALATPIGALVGDYDHLSSASYLRLLLPDLLAKELDRVIYLDCDLIILGDLGPLWHLDLGTAYAAAVPELTEDAKLVSSPEGLRLWRELGLAANARQFNSGVLVMNLERWRSDLIGYRALAYLAQARRWLRWHDQEALNVVLAGDWLPLDARWNLTMRHLAESRPSSYEAPCIIHYHTANKPWHPDYRFALRELFLDHLDRTAWSGWRPPRGPVERVRPLGRRLRKALHKRRDALRRRGVTRLRERHVSLLLGSKPLLLQNPLPSDTSRSEVRIFMVMDDDCGARERAIVQAYLKKGADRAVLAIPTGVRERWQSSADSNPRIHLVLREDNPPDEVLRVLLHWHGREHWCLLTTPGHWLRFPFDDRLGLAELTALLDEQGYRALLCRRVELRSGKNPGVSLAPPNGYAPCGDFFVERETLLKLPVTDRDPVHDRVFMADSRVAVDLPWDDHHTALRSAVPLIKYGPDVLMGPGARSVYGAPIADIEGALLAASTLDNGEEAGAPSRLKWRCLVAAGLLKPPTSMELV